MLFYRTLAKEKKFFESPCSFFCGIKQLGSPFFLEQEPHESAYFQFVSIQVCLFNIKKRGWIFEN